MADPGAATGALAERFRRFAEFSRQRAPLYSRLSTGLSDWPGLAGVFADAAEPARVPVNLFAAVHYLLLADPQAAAARFYPNLAGDRCDPGDPVPEFLAYCGDHAAVLRRLVATRLPQTNEIGRAALLVAGLDRLPAQAWAHLDVGASAGLNLILDRFSYTDGHQVLGASPIVLECSVRPQGARLASRLPEISSRLGLDAHPIDLTDRDDARWLKACVWPDQADRFQRLERAVALFGENPVPVRRGDAVTDLASTLAELGPGAPLVTTSWALCYLEVAQQSAWDAELARLGAGVDLTWLWVESPLQVPILPVAGEDADSEATLLGVSRWVDGVRTDAVLARCHPHGNWLTWR